MDRRREVVRREAFPIARREAVTEEGVDQGVLRRREPRRGARDRRRSNPRAPRRQPRPDRPTGTGGSPASRRQGASSVCRMEAAGLRSPAAYPLGKCAADGIRAGGLGRRHRLARIARADPGRVARDCAGRWRTARAGPPAGPGDRSSRAAGPGRTRGSVRGPPAAAPARHASRHASRRGLGWASTAGDGADALLVQRVVPEVRAARLLQQHQAGDPDAKPRGSG